MKTKTPAFKLRPRKSIPPSFASLTSVLFYQDEDKEEYHLHGNDNGESMDTGSSEDNDNNNDSVDDMDDDKEEGYDDDSDKGIARAYDNYLVPDDVNEEVEDDNVVPDDVNKEVVDDNVVPADVNEEAEDDDVVPDCVEVSESLRVNCVLADCLGVFSYSCNGGSCQVFVCSESGCPIAMHEVCMNTEPDFDDNGKFYCPYCWHNRVVARTLDLKREALLAKRELLNFIHLKWDVGNKERMEDGADNMKAASLSITLGGKSSVDGKNGLNDDAYETIYYNQDQIMCGMSKGKEKHDDESASKAHGADNVANVQMMQDEDIENAFDRENDGNDENTWRALEDIKRKSRTLAKDATSKVPAIESFEHVSSDLGTGALVRQKRIKYTAQRARPWQVDSPKNPSFQPDTSAKDKMTNLQGNPRTEKNSVKCQELNKKMIPIMSSGKRRPLPWTIEEVDMLKEGVRRFSLTANKNMPWKKILEFGHNVFDNNRIPADLKDKWKQIMAKEEPKSNMGALIPFTE